jgi:hypothetical protein
MACREAVFQAAINRLFCCFSLRREPFLCLPAAAECLLVVIPDEAARWQPRSGIQIRFSLHRDAISPKPPQDFTCFAPCFPLIYTEIKS